MSNTFCCKTTHWDLSLWQQGAAHSWQHSQISWAHHRQHCFSAWNTFCFPFCFIFVPYLVFHFGITNCKPSSHVLLPLKVTSSSGEWPLSEDLTILISLCFSPWVRAVQAQSALTCVRNGLLLHKKISWLKRPGFWKWWSFSPLHPQRTCLAPSPAHCWMAVSAIPEYWPNSWKLLKCTSDQTSLSTPAWATSMLWLHHIDSLF